MGFNLFYCSEQDRKNYIAKNYNFKDLAYMGDGIFDVDILKEAALEFVQTMHVQKQLKLLILLPQAKVQKDRVLDACLYIKKNYLDE